MASPVPAFFPRLWGGPAPRWDGDKPGAWSTAPRALKPGAGLELVRTRAGKTVGASRGRTRVGSLAPALQDPRSHSWRPDKCWEAAWMWWCCVAASASFQGSQRAKESKGAVILEARSPRDLLRHLDSGQGTYLEIPRPHSPSCAPRPAELQHV